jgi:4-hydroxybenzoyl-CoA thioesterase
VGDNGTFRKQHKIRFSECDPAGIVFYPMYFVMFNDLLEAWIDEILPGGFHGLIGERRIGTPTVHLDVSFKAVSRMGDQVWLSLEVQRLGHTSLTMTWDCIGEDGVVRLSTTQTLVLTSLDTHRPIPIPDDLRAAIGVRAPDIA